jgi:hypothetical protein
LPCATSVPTPRRVEGENPRAPRPHPLGERPLRDELDVELAAQVLALELRVLADVGGHHPADLPGLQEQAEAPIIHAAVVRNGGQATDALPDERGDQVLGDSAETETADDERRALEDVPDRSVGGLHDLVDHP